jgi:hypothetical protein
VSAAELAEARKEHRRGEIAVLCIWVPVFLWIGHLGSMAALVAYVRDHPSRWWVFWVDTGVCAAGIIACLVIATLIGIRADTPSDDGSPRGRTRFLAWQAVLAGLANLALTLLEGSFVAFILTTVR